MNKIAEDIPGYDYGSVAPSTITLDQLEALKITAGFNPDTDRFLRMAGDVLTGQTEAVVLHWRSGIIANIPHLARHSRSPEGEPLPHYLGASNLRFQQWILDTCLRPYDQDWLDYQQEIALRHTTLKKNQTDHVQSTPFVPLRDIVAFVPVMNETIKPYLANRGHSPQDVDAMHLAWCRSIQLQIALWSALYANAEQAPNQW